MDISEKFKMECLARHVMRLCESTSQMEAWFSKWEKKHGKAARDELREYVVLEHEKHKKARDAERIKQFGSSADTHTNHKAEKTADTKQQGLFG